MIRALLAAGLMWATAGQADVTCEDLSYVGNSYTVCRVNLATSDLRLFLQRGDGGVHASFRSIESTLNDTGKTLTFAMNAGMYHANRAPVGLYVEAGKKVQRLITSAGPGNFGLLPNGVLCMNEGRADVIETLTFERDAPACRDATQSGPMLVINGDLHRRFLPDGTSRYIRNGVGTRSAGQEALFVISNNTVTFHEFGSLFRDVLETPNALYLDGNISRLHAPMLGRSDGGFAMGPIVGTVAPAE